jgi:hypothetical protein
MPKRSRGVAAEEFDAELLDALQHAPEPFLPGTNPLLTDARMLAALELVRDNRQLRRFGLDGTGCSLGAAAAKALGGVQAQALVFPFPLVFTKKGHDAFIEAVGTNGKLESITLAETNIDGGSDRGTCWSPEGSEFVDGVQQRRRRNRLPELAFAGAEAFAGESEEEQSESGEEGEGDDEDACVQCDRRECRRELRDPAEAVYTSSFGQDYCEACAATFRPDRRAALRKSTVAERLEAGD